MRAWKHKEENIWKRRRRRTTATRPMKQINYYDVIKWFGFLFTSYKYDDMFSPCKHFFLFNARAEIKSPMCLNKVLLYWIHVDPTAAGGSTDPTRPSTWSHIPHWNQIPGIKGTWEELYLYIQIYSDLIGWLGINTERIVWVWEKGRGSLKYCDGSFLPALSPAFTSGTVPAVTLTRIKWLMERQRK